MARRKSEEIFWHLGAELSTLNDEIVAHRPKLATGRAWEPRVDIVETELDVVIKVELAGVPIDSVQFEYSADTHSLVVRGQRMEDEDSHVARTGIHQLEIYSGQFMREIRLPDVSIDVSNVRVRSRDGILCLSIPKTSRVVITRTIRIHKH